MERGSNDFQARRACHQCNKKKVKCDMLRPKCALCQRVGSSCTFPTKRKRPEIRKGPQEPPTSTDLNRVRYLMSMLESELQNDHGLVTPLTPSQSSAQMETLRAEDQSQNTGARMQDPSPYEMDMGFDQATDVESFQVESCKSPPKPEAAPCSRPLLSASGIQNVCFNAQSLHQGDPPTDAITPEVERELIDIYFNRIQAWLPLLHRPKFYEKYVASSLKLDSEALSIEERLIFKCIFALAARYSKSPAFAEVDQLERGVKFADQAKDLYEMAREAIDPPNLLYLQGCILLAFYWYTSGPCARGWILSGVCVRLAYDLDLSALDEEDSEILDAEDWVRKEELRRAFWLVWELDAFGSTISKRPYAIDRRRIAVHLPVSDEAWFAERPVSSVRLDIDPSKAWKSLQKSENQDERAWFLIANFLMSLSHDLNNRQNGVTIGERLELQNAFNCFKLNLPAKFNLETGIFSFDAQDFAQSNWIISTHLMIAGCDALISNLSTSVACQIPAQRSQARNASLHSRAAQISRIISRWSPDFVSLAHPFIACTMLPIHIPGDGTSPAQPRSWSHHQELVKLVLSHFAKVWKLGMTLLTLATLLEKPQKMNSNHFEIARRFAVYFPHASISRDCRTRSFNPKRHQRALVSNSHHYEDTRYEAVEAHKTPKNRQNGYVVSAHIEQDSWTSDHIASMPAIVTHDSRYSIEDPKSQSRIGAVRELSDSAPVALGWQDSDPNLNSNMLDFFGRIENLDFLEF